ncbi:hypothetical protein NHX12_025432 [Muraenolepis orangiensis]|uniref:Protein FAM53B n=1 Tax=Muraenolepis orangiensis TaxID=630683 RepID=A0A9Q0EJ55_9TELE|nr:hypothetical protein NHX12_025432 [Muraenolepis orangiensis]
MVIIFQKTSDKKRAEDVTSKRTDRGQLREMTMSQGTALFSCGLMETGRWRDAGRGCSGQPVGTSLESLWDAVPEESQSPTGWDQPGLPAPGTISGLLQELSLADSSFSTAPPSKRQCRSLSCSDELAGCRSPWRPQGSRVWTAVEKRRCHSGGSVHRGGGAGMQTAAFPAMQRSSSFSLPARSNAALEMPCFSRGLICLPPRQGASPASSPDSTPELERRGVGAGQGGLARSRSQPCVLNDKKVGVKRRRPADSQRPSLDLAKMTQKLRNFHSLSCAGTTGDHGSPSSESPPTLRGDFLPLEDAPFGTKEGGRGASDPAIEEPGWGSPDYDPDAMEGTTTRGKESQHLWVGLCSPLKDMYQLGGELDIEQIERN